MAKKSAEPEVKLTLGQYLASIREDRDLSQRDVEKATNKVVSNAYLSQIENGLIKKPNPNILYALSELYAIGYEDLMERAGYIVPTRSRGGGEQRHGRVATFAGHNLTDEEEAELVQFLGYLRSRKKPGGQS
jgi:transcriptional regulator with XRE-family HTH domain